jgi:hypothetical protein
MLIKFPEALLFLLVTGLCGGLASPEHQKLIGHSQSGFDTVRKA